MKLLQKFVLLGVALLLTQATLADQNRSWRPSSPPKECPKPCPEPCFERGYSTNCQCTSSSYNEPAGFDLGPCSWDVWLDASFTYWVAQQEGMGIAWSTAMDTLPAALVPVNGRLLSQDTSFKPGFKVGLGADIGHDDWNVFAEYTWFRSRTHMSSNPPADPRVGTVLFVPVVTSIWQLQNWFIFNPNATNVSSTWRLRMDLLDVAANRPYYQGKSLIVSPFGGVRAAWIRQNLKISILTIISPIQLQNNEPLNTTSHNLSYSWAVGPRGGFEAKWHLGYGFRFEGDVAGSVLFTRFTKVKHVEGTFSTEIRADEGPILGGRFSDYNCLRACTEMNLGLGWGTYFDCYNYHWDIVATYDFQVFWNQNMMRQLVEVFDSRSGHSPGNLYLQGLVLASRFDF